LLCVIAGIVLAEISLHLHKRPLEDTTDIHQHIAQLFHAPIKDVSITTPDAAILRAWFIQPPNSNGRSVILLHGITDNRIGMSGYADMFLNHGYAVLLPDSREHGESGGNIATYGIRERYDVAQWAQWLRQRIPGCTYLLGESMGAEIGLQATAVTPQLCAAAVESPYSTFRTISYERLGRGSHTSPFFWKTLARPILEVAIFYTRIRYGIYLPNASPLAAVQQSTVPTLLIAGTADQNIPMHHAQELEAACPTHCVLWIVPGAGHGGASTIAYDEFNYRILNWFQSHNKTP